MIADAPVYRIKQYSMELIFADGSSVPRAVLQQALQDEDSEVRVCAAFTLAKSGDLRPHVLDILFYAADWRRDPEAGGRARYGIIELAKTNPAIIEHLLAALVQNRQGLSGVAECLGKIGEASPAVINGLLSFIQQSADSYAVVGAIYSLLELGYLNDALIEQLPVHYQRGDGIVRRVVLRVLGMVKQPSAKIIDLLLAALKRGQFEAINAAETLAQIGVEQPKVVDALLQASRDNDGQVRGAALAALGLQVNA